jgi:hypothetical protein
MSSEGQIVHFSVGGTRIVTTRETLCKIPGTWFDEHGRTPESETPVPIFVDRDPMYFLYMINYLRGYPSKDVSEFNIHGLSGLVFDAEFYRIPEIQAAAEQELIKQRENAETTMTVVDSLRKEVAKDREIAARLQELSQLFKSEEWKEKTRDLPHSVCGISTLKAVVNLGLNDPDDGTRDLHRQRFVNRNRVTDFERHRKIGELWAVSKVMSDVKEQTAFTFCSALCGIVEKLPETPHQWFAVLYDKMDLALAYYDSVTDWKAI